MNLKEIIAGGKYTIFSRMTLENKKAHIEAVDYIKVLAASSSTNLDNWNIISIFGTGSGNKLILDRREINKLFFKNATENKKNREEHPVKELEASIFQNLPRPRNNRERNVIQRLEDQKNAAKSKMQQALFSAKTQLANLVQANRQLLALNAKTMDLTDQVRQINAGGFWEFSHIEKTRVYFKTISEVIVRHKQKSQGIDITVNLGRFFCFIDMKEGNELHLRPLSNNVMLEDGLLHPHGALDSICWGAASETLYELLATFDYVGAMKLFANLLCDYNSGDAFAGLHEFYLYRCAITLKELKKAGRTQEQIDEFVKSCNLDDEEVVHLLRGDWDSNPEDIERLVEEVEQRIAEDNGDEIDEDELFL